MTEWDTNAHNAICALRDTEDGGCKRCGAPDEWDCGCADELRARERDERDEDDGR